LAGFQYYCLRLSEGKEEGWGNGQVVEQSDRTLYNFLALYMGVICSTSNNDNIKDHRSQITIIDVQNSAKISKM
jgi:hypothetical protein